jgi:hypothetical protein
MKGILANLRDPAWWFSAFFVAIVASLLAGFVKDRIAKALEKYWSWYRGRRRARSAQRLLVIDELAAHPEYLALEVGRTTNLTLLWIGTVVLFLAGPSFLATVPTSERTVLEAGFVRWGVVVLGIVSVMMGFRLASRVALVADAYKRFREKAGFTRIP